MAANATSKATEEIAVPTPEPKDVTVYETPKRVEPSVPENSLPFENLVNGPDIVILGTRGDVFNPGLGNCVRLVWQYLEPCITEEGDELGGYRTHGANREFAWESLVSETSIPARIAAEIEETGDVRVCQVQHKSSKLNPGQNYYILV